MDSLLLVLMLAVVVEGVVEYIKSLIKAITTHQWKCLITQLSAIAVSIVLCFAAGVNLFTLVGLEFRWSWVGITLTGLFASRGANYVNTLIDRLGGAGKPTAE